MLNASNILTWSAVKTSNTFLKFKAFDQEPSLRISTTLQSQKNVKSSKDGHHCGNVSQIFMKFSRVVGSGIITWDISSQCSKKLISDPVETVSLHAACQMQVFFVQKELRKLWSAKNLPLFSNFTTVKTNYMINCDSQCSTCKSLVLVTTYFKSCSTNSIIINHYF